MYEFKIGGKVTISENEEYIIVDIVEYNKEKYYFASSMKKPITPVIFQKNENNNGETYIKIIEDSEIIKYVMNQIADNLEPLS